MNKLKIIICVLSLFLIHTLSISAISIHITTNNTDFDIIIYGKETGDYRSIQDAIDAASDGDTIFVKNGTYYENLVIKKSIKLIGEDKYNTIIDGGIKTKLFKKDGIVIKAETDNIQISNFTIRNATGINDRGIYFLKNNIKEPSENNIITDNIIINCSYGLMVVNAKNNIILKNSFYGCSGGVYYPNLPYYNNIFSDNTVNDRPILSLINKENMIIEGNYSVVSLRGCRNITIKNLSTAHITVGIALSYSENITVTNCTIKHTNRGGISVHNSSNCRFIKNTFENDNWGIFLRKSNNNQMLNNNFLKITKYDWFAGSYNNIWDGNYWEKPLNHLKLIYGKIGFFEKLPWFNIDWNPALVLN